MKKVYFLFLLAALFSVQGFSQVPFTAGNIVVYRVGNGTDTLSSAGIALTIDEYSTSGDFVRSHPMPTTLEGSNRRIIASGSATADGQINRSVDKKFLLVPGYDTIPDPARLGLTNSPAANVNRVVGIVGADGVTDASTAFTDTSYNASNFRSAVSTNGTDLWLGGTASFSAAAGVRYAVKGANSSKRLSSTPTNIRAVGIFNGQLYITTGSGAFKAISSVGTGLPVDSPQVITVLPGFPNTTANGPDPYGFSISPAGNIAYVADSRTKANGGGVQRWALNAGTWSLQYTLDSGLTIGLKNLLVDWTGNTPTIYAVSGEPVVKNLPGNKILKVVDADSTSAFAIIATAAANTVFRGIAFAPENATASTVYTFTGNGLWTVAANWANNLIPPASLPAAASIVIDPAAGGSCTLNVAQNIQPGGSLTVKPGKNLLVQGGLTIQ